MLGCRTSLKAEPPRFRPATSGAMLVSCDSCQLLCYQCCGVLCFVHGRDLCLLLLTRQVCIGARRCACTHSSGRAPVCKGEVLSISIRGVAARRSDCGYPTGEVDERCRTSESRHASGHAILKHDARPLIVRHPCTGGIPTDHLTRKGHAGRKDKETGHYEGACVERAAI
jgi:hypothetical protein